MSEELARKIEAMVGGGLFTALLFELLDAKSGVWTKLDDTAFISKVNKTVENTITKLFSKADQYALLSGKIEKVLESLKTSLSEEAFQYLKNNLKKDQISDLMEAVRKLEKELGNTELKLSEAQAGKLLEGLKDGKSVDSMVAELKTWCEGGLKDNCEIIDVLTADEVNTIFEDTMGYEPPYKPGTSVYKIQLSENTKYVRVYDKINSNMQGGWIMRAEDVVGLTPIEIQSKFALPNTPIYICDVELKAGTLLRAGEANPLFGYKGGGLQYDLIINEKKVGKFINERKIIQ